MSKESSGTSPNGRGSVKGPEMKKIIQLNLTVKTSRKEELVSLPIYECPIFNKNVSYQNKKRKSRLNSFRNSLKILTKRFACNINFLYLSNF